VAMARLYSLSLFIYKNNEEKPYYLNKHSNKSALSSLQTLDIQFFKINNNRATLQMALI